MVYCFIFDLTCVFVCVFSHWDINVRAGTEEGHVAILDKFQAHPSVFCSLCAETNLSRVLYVVTDSLFPPRTPWLSLTVLLSTSLSLTYTLTTTGVIRKPTRDQFSHIPPTSSHPALSHSADCSPGTLGLWPVSGT